MSDLSDHTVYCIIITGQCQVFSFEWAFFSKHSMWRSYVTQIACEEWQTEFSDCSICFLFSSFDIWYGQPGVGSPSSGGIWELGLFCWIFRGARGRSTYFCGLLSDTEWV